MFGGESRRSLRQKLDVARQHIKDLKRQNGQQKWAMDENSKYVKTLGEERLAKEEELLAKQERIVELLDQINGMHEWIGKWAMKYSSTIEQLDIDIDSIATAWDKPGFEFPWTLAGDEDELQNDS